MLENFRQESINTTLEKNYMPYAMSVIVSRAIPEIDGFKPSHRKLLYTMYKMGLLTGPKTKSANVVGQTMRLNPHGDSAIYETMVRLTRGNEALLHPYIDSKGNFGKQYSRDMQYAASRYTEVKLDKICTEIFQAIEKNVIEMRDNYDGTMLEPSLLPVSFPTILLNANQGIAVGMASNICPFNLKEICDTTIAYIKDQNHDFLTTMPAPDFPSGALLIYNKEAMNQIYQTGKGSFKLRAKYSFDKKNYRIEINEIPYTTNLETIIDDISELIKTGKIKDIVDVRDETDLGGLKLSIEIKKATDVETLMQKLYKLTSLESTFSCNFNILVNDKAKVLGIKEILDHWLTFRRNCFKNELNFDLQKLNDKYHLLVGLEKIILDLDKAIEIIRNTPKESEVIKRLVEYFSIDEIQANYIADIKLRHLNQEYLLLKLAEKKELLENIEEVKSVLNSDYKINQAIRKQLEKIAKTYGQARKTELIEDTLIEEVSEEVFIEDYRLKLFITEHGYLKKIPLTSLRSNPEIKIKDDDRITRVYECNNRTELLVFSSKANCYKLQLPFFPDCRPSEWGVYLPGALGMEVDEKVVFVIPSMDYKGELIFAYENGKMSRILLNSYETKTKRKKLIGAFSVQDKLVSISYIPEFVENSDFNLQNLDLQHEEELEKIIVAWTSKQKIFLFNYQLVPLKQTRTTQGVTIATLRSKAKLVACATLGDLLNIREDRDIALRSYFNKNGTAFDTNELFTELKKFYLKKIPSSGSNFPYLFEEGKQISLKLN